MDGETSLGTPHRGMDMADAADHLSRMAMTSRRSFLAGSAGTLAAFSLGGCATFNDGIDRSIYGAVPNEPYPSPAADVSEVDPNLLRRVVAYNGNEPPGTIVIDLNTHHLQFVQADGTAIRYGVNGPREAFEWSGVAYIDRKAHWPIWTPTPDQIGRDPSLVEYAGGMPPGLNNPLGSRALYLYQNGVYTLCTI